jgi:hypothetical protein
MILAKIKLQTSEMRFPRSVAEASSRSAAAVEGNCTGTLTRITFFMYLVLLIFSQHNKYNK